MDDAHKELVKRLRAQGRKNYGLSAAAADALEAMAGEVAKREACLCYKGGWIDRAKAAEAERDRLAGEVERLKRMLFPYAEDKEISGMSWDGFYLIGNKKSIDELKRMENRSAQLETYRAEFVRRNEAAESERDRLAGEVERLKALLPAEMEGRAILFEACPVGHGNLRGENWVKHDCVICERDRLKAALEAFVDPPLKGHEQLAILNARKALGGDE